MRRTRRAACRGSSTAATTTSALGHVHAHEIVSRTPFIAYPGNLQGRHARETGPKGALVVEFDSAKVTRVEHRAARRRALGARTYRAAEGATTLDAVADELRTRLSAACADAGERLLAVRVEIAGVSAAHAALRADPERLLGLVRAAALEVDAGSVWIERVTLATHAPLAEFGLGGRETGPLAELGREIAALESDPALLEAFVTELARLCRAFAKATAGRER